MQYPSNPEKLEYIELWREDWTNANAIEDNPHLASMVHSLNK